MFLSSEIGFIDTKALVRLNSNRCAGAGFLNNSRLSLQQKREDGGVKELRSCGWWFFGLGVHDVFVGSYTQ